MKFHARFATLVVSGLLTSAPLGAALAGDAPPTAGPTTAEVLGQLHMTNVMEYRMGRMGLAHGSGTDIHTFSDTIISDHDAADDKVCDLAKAKGITLAAHTPVVVMAKVPMGSGFDGAFARAMLKDHEHAIASLKAARQATQDAELKGLLDDLLPMMVKHAAMAQSLADQEPGKT